MIARLFIGAAVQWFVTGFATRMIASGSSMRAFVGVCGMQALWFLNIGPATEERTIGGMTAWCLGSGIGTVLGIWATQKPQ